MNENLFEADLFFLSIYNHTKHNCSNMEMKEKEMKLSISCCSMK